LALSGREFLPAAALVIAHLAVMVVEAVITGTIVVFLRRVKPEVLVLAMRLPTAQPARA
jgi:cobalt/nickel transport system permease protein